MSTTSVDGGWSELAQRVLAGHVLERAEAMAVLQVPAEELLGLLDAAFAVRRHFFGWRVALHVIRNAKSGGCSEDCAYCSQSFASQADIACTSMQTEDELLEGAHAAHAIGAVRYCVVCSGRRPTPDQLATVCRAARSIKRAVPIQLCVSLGSLEPEQARQLKAAGVDRYNHNLETSERFYPSICSTHSYADRRATAHIAKDAGLELCSGALLGMGESLDDRVDLAFALRDARADSIPVNLLDPRAGTRLAALERLKPLDALRALAMFRFAMPDREVRVAGGREVCLGALQILALYPANSMFTTGYLTTPGQGVDADRKMLEAAGFEVAEITDA
jgi:biotin synthase